MSKDEKDTILTISETKELLEDIDPDELDQIQRRTLDYAKKPPFWKVLRATLRYREPRLDLRGGVLLTSARNRN